MSRMAYLLDVLTWRRALRVWRCTQIIGTAKKAFEQMTAQNIPASSLPTYGIVFVRTYVREEMSQ